MVALERLGNVAKCSHAAYKVSKVMLIFEQLFKSHH